MRTDADTSPVSPSALSIHDASHEPAHGRLKILPVSSLLLDWESMRKFESDQTASGAAGAAGFKEKSARWLADFLAQYPPVRNFLGKLGSEGFSFSELSTTERKTEPSLLLFDEEVELPPVGRRTPASILKELETIASGINMLFRELRVAPSAAANTTVFLSPRTAASTPLASRASSPQTSRVQSPFSYAANDLPEESLAALIAAACADAAKAKVFKPDTVFEKGTVKDFYPSEVEPFRHLEQDSEGRVYFYWITAWQKDYEKLGADSALADAARESIKARYNLMVDVIKTYQNILKKFVDYPENDTFMRLFGRLFCALTEVDGALGRYTHFLSGKISKLNLKALFNLYISFVNFSDLLVFIEKIFNKYQYHGCGVFSRIGDDLGDFLEGRELDNPKGLRGTKPGDTPNAVYWLAQDLINQEERTLVDLGEAPDALKRLKEIYDLQSELAALLHKTHQEQDVLVGSERESIEVKKQSIIARLESLVTDDSLFVPLTASAFEVLIQNLHPHRSLLAHARAKMKKDMTLREYIDLKNHLNTQRVELEKAAAGDLGLAEKHFLNAYKRDIDAALEDPAQKKSLAQFTEDEKKVGQQIADQIEFIRKRNAALTVDIQALGAELLPKIASLISQFSFIKASAQKDAYLRELSNSQEEIHASLREANASLAYKRLREIYDSLSAKKLRLVQLDRYKVALEDENALTVFKYYDEIEQALEALRITAQRLDRYEPGESPKAFEDALDALIGKARGILKKAEDKIAEGKKDAAGFATILSEMTTLRTSDLLTLTNKYDAQKTQVQKRYQASSGRMRETRGRIVKKMQGIREGIKLFLNKQARALLEEQYHQQTGLLMDLTSRKDAFDVLKKHHNWFDEVDALEAEAGQVSSSLPLDWDLLERTVSNLLDRLTPRMTIAKRKKLEEQALKKFEHHLAYHEFLGKLYPIYDDYHEKTTLHARQEAVLKKDASFRKRSPEDQLSEVRSLVRSLQQLQGELETITALPSKTIDIKAPSFSSFTLAVRATWLKFIQAADFKAQYQNIFSLLEEVDAILKTELPEADFDALRMHQDSCERLLKKVEASAHQTDESVLLDKKEKSKASDYVIWFYRNLLPALDALETLEIDLETQLGKTRSIQEKITKLVENFELLDFSDPELDRLQGLLTKLYRFKPEQLESHSEFRQFVYNLMDKFWKALQGGNTNLIQLFKFIGCFNAKLVPNPLKELWAMGVYQLAEALRRTGESLTTLNEDRFKWYARAFVLYPECVRYGGLPLGDRGKTLLQGQAAYCLDVSIGSPFELNCQPVPLELQQVALTRHFAELITPSTTPKLLTSREAAPKADCSMMSITAEGLSSSLFNSKSASFAAKGTSFAAVLEEYYQRSPLPEERKLIGLKNRITVKSDASVKDHLEAETKFNRALNTLYNNLHGSEDFALEEHTRTRNLRF